MLEKHLPGKRAGLLRIPPLFVFTLSSLFKVVLLPPISTTMLGSHTFLVVLFDALFGPDSLVRRGWKIVRAKHKCGEWGMRGMDETLTAGQEMVSFISHFSFSHFTWLAATRACESRACYFPFCFAPTITGLSTSFISISAFSSSDARH